MKFFCIVKNGQKITKNLIKESVIKKGIEFIEINVNDFSFHRDYFLDNDKNERGVLYRIASGEQAKNVECKLLSENKNIVTFYKRNKDAFFDSRDISLQGLYDIPIIKTVNFIVNDFVSLKDSVDYLGGFPVIIKVTGRSHGEGVMKIESMESLVSVVGFLKKMDVANMVLREFIDSCRHARMVVLGDNVIDSIEYIAPENDFRTNTGFPLVRKEDFPDSFKEIAVNAVKAMNCEFGGVDILIDKKNNPHLAEVNFPCYFPRNQLTTGVDISGMMVDFLINKSSLINDDKK